MSYDYFRDAFVVAAGRSYSPGQQVMVSYGQQSNDSLMQYYGFSERGNPADVYVMADALRWVSSLSAPPEGRVAALEAAGGGLGAALRDVAVTRVGFAPRTLQALRFLLADAAAAAGGPGAFEQPGDAALERRVGLALVHACQQELASLGTTLEEDLAAQSSAKGGGGGGGGAGGAVDPAALAFRIEKKRVLTDCLKALTGEGEGGGSS